MLIHCDFVYAGESAKFQMPFVNLALVPEFGSSFSVPARIGHIRAAELILLGLPVDARRAEDLGFVTQVVPDQNLLATATETARQLAAKPAGALQACKRLMKRSFREQIKAAIRARTKSSACEFARMMQRKHLRRFWRSAACLRSPCDDARALARPSRSILSRASGDFSGSEVKHWTFRELHDRVAAVAAGLSRHGFRAGDRLAVLLPNEPEYLELIYACSWLGVIAVPVNARSSAAEIDRVLADASPRGLIRHSSLPVPTVHLSWELVLDKEPLDAPAASCPDPIYDPDAILALIYTSGTTGHPKGVRRDPRQHPGEYRPPQLLDALSRRRRAPPRGADFSHCRLSVHVRGAGVRHLPGHDPEVQPGELLRDGARERVSHTVLVPTMINLLTQFPELEQFDLTSLEALAYGGSPMSPELIRRTERSCRTSSSFKVTG